MDRRRLPVEASVSPRVSRASRGSGGDELVERLDRAQFRANAFVRELAHARLVGSMGRVAAAGDNAAMESFFALLQKNVLDRQRWSTREELRLAMVVWIERTYHRKRRQHRLGKLTPIEFEQ